MKVLAYCVTEDEERLFKSYPPDSCLEVAKVKENLTEETVCLTKGYEAVWIQVICKITPEIARKLHENGVKYIASRAAGTDHMDLKALARYGIKAANVPSYSPNAVSEHTILLILSLLRKMKTVAKKVDRFDFTLGQMMGRELNAMKVGVFGSGRIGRQTIRALYGFGCRIFVCDLCPNDDVRKYAEYTEKEELFHQCDILVFHCPGNGENYHMINRDTIRELKNGVILVNTARGSLFDYAAVLEGLKNGKIGALAMDVYEDEEKFIRRKLCGEADLPKELTEMLSMDQVVYTPHISFFTDQAVANMHIATLNNLKEYAQSGRCANELIS